ncbi:uncharacterized protein TNCV_1978611 [Trichonephila clavipes]|nr:uncharacterized protein TNCV_1978611 [Trichonephila clavipes]
MNSIQGGVFRQDNSHPRTADVTQRALQSIDILPWPARSPGLSPIVYVWNIFGQQLQHYPQPSLTIPVLHKKYNNHRTAYHKMTFGTCTTQCIHACIQNSGVTPDY